MAKNNNTDIAFIEALAELLNSKDLGEIEVLREYGENDSLEVRVAKPAPAAVANAPVVMSAAPAPTAVAAPPAPSAAETANAPDEDAASLSNAETSPMVGTVYLAAEPGAAPFIKAGDTVEQGQTLLIIEAMKTMNQIPASKAGVVKRILVDDSTPVEFGDPLVIIE